MAGLAFGFLYSFGACLPPHQGEPYPIGAALSVTFAQPTSVTLAFENGDSVSATVVELVGRLTDATGDTMLLSLTALRRPGQNQPEGAKAGTTATITRSSTQQIRTIADDPGMVETTFGFVVAGLLVVLMLVAIAWGSGAS